MHHSSVSGPVQAVQYGHEILDEFFVSILDEIRRDPGHPFFVIFQVRRGTQIPVVMGGRLLLFFLRVFFMISCSLTSGVPSGSCTDSLPSFSRIGFAQFLVVFFDGGFFPTFSFDLTIPPILSVLPVRRRLTGAGG